MMNSMVASTEAELTGLLTALGIGLLIGAVRERRKQDGLLVVAGLRTHAVAALMGGVGAWFGPMLLLAVVVLVGLFVLLSYRYTAKQDPGLTSEVALVLTVMLGALAMSQPALAAGIGVVTAILLEARDALHRLTRELLTERELHDALILLASALVILPLLPSEAIDPWGSLRPHAIWRVVVLVMGVGMLGHVALRWAGKRWGLAIAGFFSGLVSSTAAVASFGAMARKKPHLQRYSVAAALLANLASLVLMIGIVASLSPMLLEAALLPLSGACLALVGASLLGLGIGADRDDDAIDDTLDGRSFTIRHAVALAGVIALVMLLSAIGGQAFGARGAIAVAGIAALAEWHAPAASLAELSASGALSLEAARWGLVLLLASGSVAKGVLAWISGGVRYGLAVGAAMALATTLAALITLWQ